jgi:hypothetical protein
MENSNNLTEDQLNTSSGSATAIRLLKTNNGKKHSKKSENVNTSNSPIKLKIKKHSQSNKSKQSLTSNNIRFSNFSDLTATVNKSNTNKSNTLHKRNKFDPININFLTITELENETLQKAEKEEEKAYKINNLNQVIKLHHWEYENIKWKDAGSTQSYINNADGQDSINYISTLKNSLGKLKLKNISNQLLEFYLKCEEEQGTMLLQNVSVNKTKFNYDIFLKEEQRQKLKKDYHNIMIEYNGIPENKFMNFTNEEENIKNKIKEYKKNGIIDHIGKTDFYRDIIKEKQKIEEIYYVELCKIANLIYKNKTEIKNLRGLQRDISNYLKSLADEYLTKKHELETMRESLRLKIEKEKETENERPSQLKTSVNFKRNSEIKKSKDQEDFDNSVKSFNNKMRVLKQFTMNKKGGDSSFLLRYENFQSCHNIETDIKHMNNTYNQSKEKYGKIYEEKRQGIVALEQDMNKLKTIYHFLCKDQKKYYLDILKHGLDVREEGLSWVVKKLMELNTHLEYSMFPRFLDHSNVDYLIKYSNKSLEIAILRLMIKSIKSKKISNTNDPNYLNTVSAFNSNDKFMNTITSSVSQSSYERLFKGSNVLIHNIHYIQNEENTLSQLVNLLKRKIKSNEDLEISETNYFFQQIKPDNEEMKRLKKIKDQVEQNEKELIRMKQQEIKLFKRKNDSFKMDKKQSVMADLIFSALFGNDIAI